MIYTLLIDKTILAICDSEDAAIALAQKHSLENEEMDLTDSEILNLSLKGQTYEREENYFLKQTILNCFFDYNTQKSRKEYFADLKIMHEFCGYKFGLEYPLFQFDTDWQWLWEVVDKIVSLKDVYPQERQRIFNCVSPDIEKTYETCVEFIKWYNGQK